MTVDSDLIIPCIPVLSRFLGLYEKPKLFLYIFRVSLRVHGSAFAGFHQVPSTVWQVSLATGRLTNSPTLLLYTGPVYRVI